MDNNVDSIFSDLYIHFREFLAKFGWPILITLFLLYYFKPQIKQWRHEYSIKRANHPMRVEILNEDMKRVRARQQLEHLKATAELPTSNEEETTQSNSNELKTDNNNSNNPEIFSISSEPGC